MSHPNHTVCILLSLVDISGLFCWVLRSGVQFRENKKQRRYHLERSFCCYPFEWCQSSFHPHHTFLQETRYISRNSKQISSLDNPRIWNDISIAIDKTIPSQLCFPSFTLLQFYLVPQFLLLYSLCSVSNISFSSRNWYGSSTILHDNNFCINGRQEISLKFWAAFPFGASFRYNNVRSFVNQTGISPLLINALNCSAINLWKLLNMFVQNPWTTSDPSTFQLLLFYKYFWYCSLWSG